MKKLSHNNTAAVGALAFFLIIGGIVSIPFLNGNVRFERYVLAR